MIFYSFISLVPVISKKVVNPLCLELLIQYGADVNAQMWNGWTALHEAAFRGNTSVIKRLLQEGASVDAKDDYDIQPVFTAAQYGHVECLKILLEAGNHLNLTSFSLRKISKGHLCLAL